MSGCHDASGPLPMDKPRFLLMGNPNVGKSVIFSKLTGLNAHAANYTGTTVSYTSGTVVAQGQQAVLIDVPGTYSLDSPSSPAEKIAAEMLAQGANAVIFVLDATNLERNLNLALQVAQRGLPVVYALNLSDVATQRGTVIDDKGLAKELSAPVITTVATRNQGLRALLEKTAQAALDCPPEPLEPAYSQYWEQAAAIAAQVEKQQEYSPGFWERMGDLTLKPWPGLPIAVLALSAMLGLVVGGGKALRSLLLLPLVNDLYAPWISSLVSSVVPAGVLQNILIGEYGALIKGVEWPFALILPYVFLFYVALSLLEDTGYMPRLGVLVDNLFRKMGIQGGNIVPFIMGYGCAVPAILGTRAATSQRERLMVTTLVCLAVPCVAQTGAFIALLGDHSLAALLAVYLFSLVAIFTAGLVLNKMVRGETPPMLMEIPNLLPPDGRALAKKIWLRTRHFMLEAEIPMVLGIAIAALLAETGALESFGRFIAPLVTGWLGLPPEATLGLILGIIRRELAVLPLLELNLTTFQLFVGSIVALFYLPCLSVLAVIIREFNLKTALAIALFTIVAAFLVGGLINQLGSLISMLMEVVL